MKLHKINLEEKAQRIDSYWKPGIVAELNGQHVKLAKIKGEFVWHQHENEDELFMVLEGELKIEFRDRTEVLNKGEMIVVPRGVEHKPIAEHEVTIMLFEPNTTLNTGNVESELSRHELDWL